MTIKERLLELKQRLVGEIKTAEDEKTKLAEDKKKAEKLAEDTATAPTIESLQAEIVSMSEDLAALVTRVDALEGTETTETAATAEEKLQKEIAKLKTQLDEISKDKSVETLKEEIESLKTQLTEAKKPAVDPTIIERENLTKDKWADTIERISNRRKK